MHDCPASSSRPIAAALDRSTSSVSRELKRNSGSQVGYQPSYADEQARARRWRGSRLERDGELRELVLGQLAHARSPEQIAGRSSARDEQCHLYQLTDSFNNIKGVVGSRCTEQPQGLNRKSMLRPWD